MDQGNKEFNVLKSQLDAILQSSYDGMYITDGEGVFLKVNNGLERITGFKKEALLGSNARELFEKGIISRSVVHMVLAEKKGITIKQTIVGEKLKEVMVTATPIIDEKGNVAYVVANLRDMTDLVYLENECNKAQALSNQYYSKLLEEKGIKGRIIAESEEMRQLLKLAYRVAQVDAPVLLEGESGTGKEVFANFIHEMSSRSNEPFVSINCAGVPETLLEAELFGYEEGAFTGAKRGGNTGLIEAANGGTLFLDEINSLPLESQGKLLKAIESYEINRIGSNKPLKVDFRLLAATNKNLQELIDKGSFRQDLYFRLSVLPIVLLPLRERKADIRPLALHYLDYFNKKHNCHKELSSKTLKFLEEYNWPGNVRELKNIIERIIVITERDLITENDLPNEIVIKKTNSDKFQIVINDIVPLKEFMDEAEMKLVSYVMSHCKSTREAAKILNISQSSVVNKYREVREKIKASD